VSLSSEFLYQKNYPHIAKAPIQDDQTTKPIGFDGTTRRSRRERQGAKKDFAEKGKLSQSRRPVGDRWYYEPSPVLSVQPTDSKTEEISQSMVRDVDSGEHHPAMRPTHLGTLCDITDEQLQEVTDDELGACYLQGTMFFDDELEWCLITGWGVKCGSTIVFYAPLTESHTNRVEQHASLSHVISMINESPELPNYKGYK
jgi:hypothetical protein